MLLKSEREWIQKNIPEGEEIVNFINPNDIIDRLDEFTVDELYSNDYKPTDKCVIAEKIIDRIAYNDDDWPEWNGL